MSRYFWGLLLLLWVTSSTAWAAEVCGNGVDDDGDGFSDESCYPGLTNPLVDSPLPVRETGLISPSTGSLYYPVAPDLSAKTPWGPSLVFRRTYASQIQPPGTPTGWKQPLGDRWTHNYMGWIIDYGTSMVVRLPTGQEVVAVYSGVPCKYNVRGGQGGKLTHCAGQGYYVSMLDGSSLSYATTAYSAVPMLQWINGRSNSGSLYITYGISNQVGTVTDASLNRQLAI